MVTKTQQLDDLFERWRRSDKEFSNRFVSDGIINESLYVSAPSKILFIEKDPNDPYQSEDWDFRKLWNEKISNSFSHRIAEWAFGILNRSEEHRFPEYDDIWIDENNVHLALRKIAFVNVKKSGGGGNAVYEDIKNHTCRFKEMIYKEIEIIEPEFIVLGLSWPDIRNDLFPGKWGKSGYGIEISKYNGAKVIDFFHASARGSASAYYCLLQSVFQSDKFRQL